MRYGQALYEKGDMDSVVCRRRCMGSLQVFATYPGLVIGFARYVVNALEVVGTERNSGTAA